MTADPHPIDIIVGTNLRRLRQHAGMTQTELGRSIGVTFQQIQKYERATNRVSASKLWECAQVFGVSVEAFFAPCQRPRPNEEEGDEMHAGVMSSAG